MRDRSMALRFAKRLLIAPPLFLLFLANFLTWLVLVDLIDEPDWMIRLRGRLFDWAMS